MQVSMQSLDQNSMQINTAKYSGHGWGNAPVQPDLLHLTLGPVAIHLAITPADSSTGVIKNLLEFRAGLLLLI